MTGPAWPRLLKRVHGLTTGRPAPSDRLLGWLFRLSLSAFPSSVFLCSRQTSLSSLTSLLFPLLAVFPFLCLAGYLTLLCLSSLASVSSSSPRLSHRCRCSNSIPRPRTRGRKAVSTNTSGVHLSLFISLRLAPTVDCRSLPPQQHTLFRFLRPTFLAKRHLSAGL